MRTIQSRSYLGIPDNEELKRKLKETLKQKLTEKEEDQLLERLKNGDESAKNTLLKSLNWLIYELMVQYPDNRHSIEERVKRAERALLDLLNSEQNHPRVGLFKKFAAWNIKQVLLELLKAR